MVRKAYTEAAEKPKVRTLMKWPKTDNTELHLSKMKFPDGSVVMDMRTFYKTKADPTYRPGKGITLPYDAEFWKQVRIITRKEFERDGG